MALHSVRVPMSDNISKVTYCFGDVEILADCDEGFRTLRV